MIYSRTKLMSLSLYICIFYTMFIYNIQSYINASLPNLSHMELCYDIFINTQKLLFLMSIQIIILLIGFENNYRNAFRIVRTGNSKRFILTIFKEGFVISAFIAFNATIVQLIMLPLNGLPIDPQALAITFLVVSIYAYSVYSLYIMLYSIIFDHAISLSIAILFRFLLLIFLISYKFLRLDFYLEGYIFYYIIVEILITNIITVYLLYKEERLVL